MGSFPANSTMYSKKDQLRSNPKAIIKTKIVISTPQLKKKVQRAVNKSIRERDKDKPCISCNKYDKKQAGHFIAQGSSGLLRYHPDNIHGQCVGCNKWNHGNLLEYRINLVKKIGREKVEWLENNRHKTKQWKRYELEEILQNLKK